MRSNAWPSCATTRRRALERFFGNEALALAERAAGNPEGHAAALAQAREAFAALDEGDRGWCQPTLDKLQRRHPLKAAPGPGVARWPRHGRLH